MSDKQILAVAYLRMSTDKQEASIPDQRSAVQRYAADKGYKIVREYVDDAISGDDTANRLGFQQMIADAKERGDFAVILCWDQSRFGRFDGIEAGFWIHPLRELGVSLVTVKDGPKDWNSFDGRVMYTLQQESKHQYLQDLSRDVVRGQLQGAKDNGSWLGTAPFAYRIVGEKKHKRLVKDDDSKVRLVQRIFREFVDDGRSMSNIASRLNAEGIPSPGERGKPWRYDILKVILQNPAYVGDYVGGRYANGKYHTMKGEVIAKAGKKGKKPEAEWIIKRDHHKDEAIIDRSTFEKAKAILDRGRTGRAPHTPENNPFIFSGLLRCGKCGCPMWAYISNKNHKYYRCSSHTYNGKKACVGTSAIERKLLIMIAEYIYQEFLSLDGLTTKAERKELMPDDLPKAFAKVKKLLAPPKQEKINRKQIEKQLDALRAKIEHGQRNLVHISADNIATSEDEIRKMQEQKKQLEQELNRKLPTDADINTEVLQVLRTLYCLRVTALLHADTEVFQKSERSKQMVKEWTLELKRYLRNIASITIHTRREGESEKAKHIFERGEIAFKDCSYHDSGSALPPRPGSDNGSRQS